MFLAPRITVGAPKSPSNVASTLFNTARLLPKNLRFKHGVDKLVSFHGRHLSSVRPWLQLMCQSSFNPDTSGLLQPPKR